MTPEICNRCGKPILEGEEVIRDIPEWPIHFDCSSEDDYWSEGCDDTDI